jgi:hypothetical protein
MTELQIKLERLELMLVEDGYNKSNIVLQTVLDMQKLAINYTHCCKSDSELLKGYNKYLEDYIDTQHLYDGVEDGYLKTL